MNEYEVLLQESRNRLHNLYVQLHLTVIYEKEYTKSLGSKKNLDTYRDLILDSINDERDFLGLIDND